KDILITHAGLTRGYMEHLGVSTAKEAVSLMNGFVGEVNLGGIERPGWLVTGSHNQAADTFWALCGIELNGSWWGEEGSGFNQIHGHACLYEWDGGEFWPDVSPEIRRNTLVNMADRFTITQHPNGDWFRSVDWVLKNERKRQKWPVLILPGFDVYLGE
ncbi:MAG TPA: hypothetical protein VLR89_04435, partial [Anaerolineaceae bacterium]|nr:hypothetical protein [Anaerolineaceae bacterium]